MQSVFVLSSHRKPLDSCHPARARKLLKSGQAAIFRHYPFTIILKKRSLAESVTHPHRVKIDPGSKTTGLALVQENNKTVIWAGEIRHRGELIKRRLLARRQLRRARRQRKCRYRPPRFNNRASSRRKGRLSPSLQSRVENIMTWVSRLQRYCPIDAISVELAKFDPQKMENPEIRGVEYQQGELAGYEIREYLLQKWGRKCAYCGIRNVPLQVEHIVPKSRGGSDRASNLTISCPSCNLRKGSQTAAEFGFPEIHNLGCVPLKDAAVINATRWVIFKRLRETKLPIEVGTGGRTKFNRTRLMLPKAHWMDAACIGKSGANVKIPRGISPLQIRSYGHGKRQRCRTDRYGFPVQHASRSKKFLGWQTGDLAKAVVPHGKRAGVHVGRVIIRHTPQFRVNRKDMHPKYLRLLQKNDGYAYSHKESQKNVAEKA